MQVIFAIFQTGNSANGGVESITQVLEHCQQVEPTVITQINTPIIPRWIEAGASVQVWPIPYTMGSSFYRSGPIGMARRIGSLIKTNYWAYRLVRQTGSRVVHHNDPSALWHLGWGAKLAGAKLVFNIRDTKAAGDAYGRKWAVSCWLSDRLLVLSQEMRQSLLAHLPAARRQAAKIEAIYSIVDAQLQPLSSEQRAAQRQALGIPADTVALGYVATLNDKKAQLEFIRQAVPRLRREIDTLKIYFIGDCHPDTNPYARQCLKAVEELGLAATVEFVGYTASVAAWYPALDLTVLASRQEGLARCMIESLACGTPMVSFEVCSAREILQAYDCGRVVPQGDYPALVEAIVDLARCPERRQSLGEHGQQVVQHLFQPQPIAQQYEALYQQLGAGRLAAVAVPTRLS